MADINTAIQSVIDRIQSQAATAAPNDLVYLGKALESVSPSSPVAFLVQLGENQRLDIATEGTAQKNAVKAEGATQAAALVTAGQTAAAQIGTAFTQQVATVNALGNVSGTVNVNLSQGSIITLTPTGNTTLNFTNFPPSGSAGYWEVEVVAPQSFSVTFNGVTWDNATIPSLASGTATTVFFFRTRNAGAKIYAGQSFMNIA